jgi:hypothetical protein
VMRLQNWLVANTNSFATLGSYQAEAGLS